MSTYQIETDNGTYEVEVQDTEPTIQSKNILGNMAKPITMPLELTRDVYKSGMASPTPIEDVIPPIAATGGAIAGGLATLPSGGGVPFGATLGAGIGGQAGETARQYIRAARGKETPATIQESLIKTGIEGAKYAGSELSGAALSKSFVKGLEIVGADKLARKSFNSLKDYLFKIFKSESNVPTTKNPLFKQIENKPASNLTDTGELIDNLFDERGIKYKPSKEALRQQLLREADLSNEETVQVIRDLADEKSGKLSSKLSTPDVKGYKKMGDILDDLSRKDLSYGDLYNMKNSVGDMANFGSSERTPLEKIYGSIYGKLNKDMNRTAEEGAFLDIHKKLTSEGQKYYQQKFLKSVLENSRDFKPSGEVTNYGKLSNKLNKLTDEQLVAMFGESKKNIEALRDIANTYAESFGQSNLVHPHVTPYGVSASFNPKRLLDRINLPKYTEQISSRRGVPILSPILSKTRNVSSNILRGGIRSLVPYSNE